MERNLIRISGDWTQEEVLTAVQERKFSHLMIVGRLEEPDEETGKRFWLSATMEDQAAVVYALQHANQLVLDLTRKEDD